MLALREAEWAGERASGRDEPHPRLLAAAPAIRPIGIDVESRRKKEARFLRASMVGRLRLEPSHSLEVFRYEAQMRVPHFLAWARRRKPDRSQNTRAVRLRRTIGTHMRSRYFAVAALLVLTIRCDRDFNPTGPGATPTPIRTPTPTPLACPNLSGWYDLHLSDLDCIPFPARPERFLGQEGCTIRFGQLAEEVTGDVRGDAISFSWQTKSEGCQVLTGSGTLEPSLEMPGRFNMSGTVTSPRGADQCCTRITFTLTPRRPPR